MPPTKIDIGERVVTSISMPVEQLEMLDLLSLSYEETRSSMISKLIIERNEVEESIKKIAERILSNFCKSDSNFEDYLRAAGVWLNQKKISTYHTEKILQQARLLK